MYMCAHECTNEGLMFALVCLPLLFSMFFQRFVYLYFLCMGVLPVYMSVYHVCCVHIEIIVYAELELNMVVGSHVGARN